MHMCYLRNGYRFITPPPPKNKKKEKEKKIHEIDARKMYSGKNLKIKF